MLYTRFFYGYSEILATRIGESVGTHQSFQISNFYNGETHQNLEKYNSPLFDCTFLYLALKHLLMVHTFPSDMSLYAFLLKVQVWYTCTCSIASSVCSVAFSVIFKNVWVMCENNNVCDFYWLIINSFNVKIMNCMHLKILLLNSQHLSSMTHNFTEKKLKIKYKTEKLTQAKVSKILSYYFFFYIVYIYVRNRIEVNIL
jgi:hypothetical protein